MVEEHRLDGCDLVPISSYLKALGVSRILSVKDPDITSFWKGDKFVIRTNMERDTVIRFFLEEYSPTPIVSPWSYNVYRESRDNILELSQNDKIRFSTYSYSIHSIDGIMEDMKNMCNVPEMTKEIVDKNKERLLCMCRNRLPDDAISWIDAVGVVTAEKKGAVTAEKVRFAPILGSGGNDGHFDMARNFVKNIGRMLAPKNNDLLESRELLTAALFGGVQPLHSTTTMGHNPSGSGGPNFGNGFEGKKLSNPWDYILMTEGTLLCAGSVSKHLSANRGTAVFPFTASSSTVGYHTASAEDTEGGGEPPSKGEIWMPVWERPATHAEISHIFTEGRIHLGRKSARTGTEFARAVVTLGTDRGISKFQRYCILKRKGKAYLTVNAGAIHARETPVAELLEGIDMWYNRLLGKSKKKGASASLMRLVRSLDAQIMEFCTNPVRANLMQVAISIGHLEKHASLVDDSRPLSPLSSEWLAGCYDGSAEFRLAASIASMQNPVGDSSAFVPIRENLEDVDMSKREFKKLTSRVWNANDTVLHNMERVLLRRVLDGSIRSSTKMQLYGHIPADIHDVAMFLHGKLNLKKIGDLVLPLSFINMTRRIDYPWKNRRSGDHVSLPESYQLLKLVYPPYPGHNIPHTTSILSLLQAGRTSEAYDMCVHVLRAHGLLPKTSLKTHRLGFRTVPATISMHLMASLLFPISDADGKSMIKSGIV